MAKSAPQLDLFADPPPASNTRSTAITGEWPKHLRSPIFVPVLPLPARVPAWESLLGRSSAAGRIRVMVSPLWTGVCLEVLSDPELGRPWLGADGQIGQFPPDSAHGRVVYATPEQARAWHRRRGLIPHGPAGRACATFVFADVAGAEPLAFPHPFQEQHNAN